MPIASNSAGQKKYSAEKGVKAPRLTSGMNKLNATNLATQKSDERSDADTSKKKAKDDVALIDEAKERFTRARTVESTNRKDAVEDLEFLNNKQWNPADEAERAADRRPCITENRLPTFANQIKNEQRQNRPAIVISPMGDKAAKKDAKMLRGMIRAIERDSCADVAYDTGFASAVDNGWGYWRVVTEYESHTSVSNKVLCVKPIPNPMNVYLDPNRTPFMLDYKWGIITEMLPRDDFEREYPNADFMSWSESGVGEDSKEWITKNEVRVAEYYYFEYEERCLVLLDNGHEGYKDELSDQVLKAIDAGKIEIVAERDVQVPQLKWCKLTATEILESHDCDGDYVPIIECIGTIININGKETKKGIVRDAKGPQRMLNYYATLEAENVALQPKAPWIMEEGQIDGHEDKWIGANRKSYSYLLYKGTNIAGKQAPPPQRQPFQGPPAAILAAKQGNVEAMRAVTGIRFDATMSERMQDESGKAIRELNNNANLGAYHFIDNYGRALRNTGVILTNLIPPTYDTKRIVTTLDETGTEDRVLINPDMSKAHAEVDGMSPESSAPTKIKMFNPKVGRYQVTVTIGPSHATKRVEAMESQMDFVRVLPELGMVVADLIAKNSDWEGAEEFANRIAKTLPAKLLTPSHEDMNPQVEALIQGLQTHIEELNQQMSLMGKELQDRQADRDVALEGIAKKFQAEVLKIAEKIEANADKKEMHLQSTLGRQLAEIAKSIEQQAQQSKKPKRSGGFTIENG